MAEVNQLRAAAREAALDYVADTYGGDVPGDFLRAVEELFYEAVEIAVGEVVPPSLEEWVREMGLVAAERRWGGDR